MQLTARSADEKSARAKRSEPAIGARIITIDVDDLDFLCEFARDYIDHKSICNSYSEKAHSHMYKFRKQEAENLVAMLEQKIARVRIPEYSERVRMLAYPLGVDR